MKRILGGLESAGKALGWIGTVTSSVAALAALVIALNNRDIARDNLRYQRINASLQLGTTLFRDVDNASERYGNECMAWVAALPSGSIKGWVGSGSLADMDATTPPALRCLSGLEAGTGSGARETFVTRQIFNRLNSYFLPLQALKSEAFDRGILCDDVRGIVDAPEAVRFFAIVVPGTDIERDYAIVGDFYKSRPCG